jgi:hypothetical protein
MLVGGYHLARYTIFLMPALCLLAGLGWQHFAAPRFRPFRSAATVAAAVWLCGVFGVETSIRWTQGGHDAVRALVNAPANRGATTEALLRRLNATGGRASVALVEVQLRYFVDDRITIRSLDGRTDPLLLAFVHPAYVDHIGYLRARRVGYVLALPDYNRDPTAWSLATLRSLPDGGTVECGGLTFQRIDATAVAVRSRALQPI